MTQSIALLGEYTPTFSPPLKILETERQRSEDF